MGEKIKSLIKKLKGLGYKVSPDNSSHKDPVCGMKANKMIVSENNGVTYYFCSEHCKGQFEAAPEKYI